LLNGVVRQPLAFLPRPADPENHNLFVRNRLRLSQPVNCLVTELECQHASAVVDPVERNDQYENAARTNQAPHVFHKQPLHPLVFCFADLEIVWRVQIDEREGLDWRMSVKRTPLDDLIQGLASFFRAIRIKLDTVTSHASTISNGRERGASSGARIQHTGKFVVKVQKLPDSSRFGWGEWIVTEFQFALSSQDRLSVSDYTTGMAAPT
jgi:hypothetical protein